jgi:hypothetical protein
LDAGSPRLSDISQHMPGSPTANYKAIQRLMAEVDFQEVLLRLFDEEAPFYLADVTEISRRQAKKTSYVGRLSDGKTLGFALLVVAQPYRGRAIPFAFVTYSERTLNEGGSRWGLCSGPGIRCFWRGSTIWGRCGGTWLGFGRRGGGSPCGYSLRWRLRRGLGFIGSE